MASSDQQEDVTGSESKTRITYDGMGRLAELLCIIGVYMVFYCNGGRDR
jgi:hypothetical protein